jgi:hypothetical protein
MRQHRIGVLTMRPQPKQAREHLLRALKALEDPVAYCKSEGEERDAATADAYVAGCVKARIEFALQALGEPINPYRALEVPARPSADQSAGPKCTCGEPRSGVHANWCPAAPIRQILSNID